MEKLKGEALRLKCKRNNRLRAIERILVLMPFVFFVIGILIFYIALFLFNSKQGVFAGGFLSLIGLFYIVVKLRV